MALEREKLKLEQLKLELGMEDRTNESLLGPGVSVHAVVGTRFAVAGNLWLLPRFNERDPDTFFV